MRVTEGFDDTVYAVKPECGDGFIPFFDSGKNERTCRGEKYIGPKSEPSSRMSVPVCPSKICYDKNGCCEYTNEYKVPSCPQNMVLDKITFNCCPPDKPKGVNIRTRPSTCTN